MQYLETIFVLVPELAVRQYGPDLLRGQAASALNRRIGHLRPTVRKTVERILRGQLSQLLPIQRPQLRVGKRRRQNRRRCQTCCANDSHGLSSSSTSDRCWERCSTAASVRNSRAP